MRGRAAGLVMVLAALTALLLVTGLTGARVPGTAVAGPVLGPPAAGDCVTDPFATGSVDSRTDTATLVYPRATIVPCQGDRYAEVVAVLATPAPAPQVSLPGSADSVGGIDVIGADPNSAACSSAVADYLKMPPDAAVAFGQWMETDGTFTVALIRPTVRQQAAGQRWLACVAAPDLGTARYYYSLKNAYLVGYPAVDAVSACIGGEADQSPVTVSCLSAHLGELFGILATGGSPAADTQASCRSLVAERTGMTDPTDGGQLTVRVVTDPDTGTEFCELRPSSPERTLGHSLRNLGGRPVPWG